MKKTIYALTAISVALLAYYFASQEPPLTPEQVSALRSKPHEAVAANPTISDTRLAAVIKRPPMVRLLTHEQPRIEVADEQALVDYNLKAIEQLRKIPEAAPLIDEIVEFLKNDHGDEISLNNIPADRNGLSVLDEHAMERMVGNDAIRAKWTKLMALVAEHPEALRPATEAE